MNAGSYDDNLKGGERRESQMDLLQQSQDSQGVPQLCGVNCTVRKVRAGATSGSCLCVCVCVCVDSVSGCVVCVCVLVCVCVDSVYVCVCSVCVESVCMCVYVCV